ISEMEDELQADVVEDLSDQRASDILEIMDPDDAADIIGDLPYDKAEMLLRLMGVQEARAVRKLLGYKEKTAGGIMTPEVTTVTEDMTVQQVIEHLRTAAAENENIYYIYVVGSKRVLAGVMSLRDLIVADPGTSVSELVEREVFTVLPDDDQEQVADLMSKYDLLAMPVVDEAGRLLGMVTVDDALDVMEQEADEDLAIATGRERGAELAGIWRWISRSGWLPVWAVLFLAASALVRVVGADDQFVAGLATIVVLSTIVLRVAEDVAAHVLARVIGSESEEQNGPFWRRLLGDGLMGLTVGAVVTLVMVAMQVVRAPAESLNATVYRGIGLVAAPFGLAVLLVTLAGTVAGWFAERRAEADRRVSLVAVSVALMIVGEAAFVSLFYAAQRLAASLAGA
ncbi:MAG TPA: CBS domain-containing protein, partial [Coriobacteriia bacterium]